MRNISQRSAYRPLRRKKSTSTIASYVILLVLLVIFMSTVGIDLLLSTTRLIAGFNSEEPDSKGTVSGNDVIATPELFDVPVATNSAKLNLEGTTSSAGDVTLYVNEEKDDSTTTTEDNTDFNFTFNLKPGENVIYVQHKNSAGKVKDSNEYVVTYSKEKPILDITSPQEGSRVDKPDITVTGSTNATASVKVQNEPVVLNADGSFTHTITLQEGENVITVHAEDDAGNFEEKIIKVMYEKD